MRDRPETAIKIKHLLIAVTLPDNTNSTANTVKTNLTTIFDTFQECGFVDADRFYSNSCKMGHFLTLKVRYYSQFGGEVEAIREEIEGPIHPGLSGRPPVMIRHSMTGKFHTIPSTQFDTKLFKHIRILEVLKQHPGIADHVDIRGDLPTKYIEELTKVLAVDDQLAGIAAIKAKRAKAAIRSKQPKPSGGIQSFAADMLAKDPNMDAGMKKLYQDLMRTSTKSPAVWVS